MKKNKRVNKQGGGDEVFLWPNNLHERIYAGFAASELELLCDWSLRGYDLDLPYKSSIWIYWAAELYSFGRCYREWIGLKSWYPLPIIGDHGVDLSGVLGLSESRINTASYVTWDLDRSKSLKKRSEKRIIRIPHPWITFRRRNRLSKKNSARGTVIFLSHSTVGKDFVDYDYDKYFSELVSLPEEYHPLVICMHMHDINKKYHLNFRKYGIPIVTAGDTSSPYFIERFYSIISRFNFATSNTGGSELFYCEEFGVRYFIKGEAPVYVNHSDSGLPLGEVKYRDHVERISDQRKRSLFSEFPPRGGNEKKEFVKSVLGLDVNEEVARCLFKSALNVELRRHFGQVLLIMGLTFIKRIMPSRFILSLRKTKHVLKINF